MKNIFLFSFLLVFINCQNFNNDYSNLTPKKLAEIQKKSLDLGFQLISFTSLNSNFTKTLFELELEYKLFSYIFYIKSVDESYSKSLEKFMKEFQSLLDFNEDHFKLSFIIVIAVENKEFGMYFGEIYEKKFNQKNMNVILLKQNLAIEIENISDDNEFIGFLIDSLKTGLEGKIIKPSKKWWIVVIIIIIIICLIISLVTFCCKKHKKKLNKKIIINNSESLLEEN